MSLEDLALTIEATLHAASGQQPISVTSIHASDTMSDLIAHAASSTLIVTSLNNMQLVRIAELMDAPAICLAGGVSPSSQLLAAAKRVGKTVLVSPLSPAEATSRLRRSLEEAGEKRP